MTLKDRLVSGNTAVEQRAEVADSALHGGQAPRVGEILAYHDDPATRAAKGLVRGRRHHMAMRQRIVEQTGSNQTRGVRNVCKEDGADLVGDGAEAGVIPLSSVGRGAAMIIWASLLAVASTLSMSMRPSLSPHRNVGR